MRLACLAFVVVLLPATGSGESWSTFQTRPDIFGDKVIYTAEGDLWITDLAQGGSKRLTTHEGLETWAKFSPDGSQIAFTASYDGSAEVYVMPTTGGIPVRLTYGRGNVRVQDWTADGSAILYRDSAVDGRPFPMLFTVPAKGGLAQLYPIPRAELSALAADGRLAFVPQSNEWANWFHYKAGSADDIWLYTPTTKEFKRLTNWEGVDTTPTWAGDRIYYVTEKSGNTNLWALDPATKKSTQVTKIADLQVRYPSSDGKRIVFQLGPSIAVFDPASGTVTPVEVKQESDRIHERPRRIKVDGAVVGAAIGPTGKRILVQARGQIMSVAAEEGDARIIVNQPGARAILPSWSPNGKSVAFISDQTGENELWIVDSLAASPPRKLTTGLQSNPLVLQWSPDNKSIAIQDRAGRTLLVDAATGGVTLANQADFVSSYDGYATRIMFSPDSRLLAFARTEVGDLNAIYLYDLATKQATRVNQEGMVASAPTFSPDGRFLAYLVERSVQPQWSYFSGHLAMDNAVAVNVVALTADASSPFLPKNAEEGEAEAKKTDPVQPAPKREYLLSDFGSRVIGPPIPAARYRQVEWVGGRLLLVSGGPPVLGGGGGADLMAFDIESKSMTPISAGVDGIQVSADGKKVMVGRGGKYAIMDSAGVNLKPVDLSPYSITVDPRAEWNQIFLETWRIARDFFYDPGMHGVDWNAVRTKYAAMLTQVGDRTDLTAIQMAMVSELQSGHAYVDNPSPYRTAPVSKGYLGADFVPASMGVQIKKLYRGDGFSLELRSPLVEPGVGVKEGDYILAVGGQPVTPTQDIQALLLGTVGQTIALRVNTRPTWEGSRIVRVRPLASEGALRYQDWQLGRADYVRKVGGPNFGYAHVPDMGGNGYVAFVKNQASNALKDAVIYDFRYNGGGNISSRLLDVIRARPGFYFNMRNGKEFWTRDSWGPSGYTAALCNEDAFSDGELVIEGWKKLGLGPVIGKRTGGGEVGSGGGYAMIDGGTVYIPNYGAFDAETGKWIIEGTGATPDIEVDQDPAALMAGRDPQLDKAIELLKAQLAKKPIKRPVLPPGKRLSP